MFCLGSLVDAQRNINTLEDTTMCNTRTLTFPSSNINAHCNIANSAF